MSKPTFEKWIADLRALATEKGFSAFLADADEDYRGLYDDGQTPADVLEAEIDAASQSAAEDAA